MKYITNAALREWVKEDLRISIFQLAHKLATQTGCEVLVKLEEKDDHSGCQYYATKTLNLQYVDKGLCKQPWEMMVSGVSGLPVSHHGAQSSAPSTGVNQTSAALFETDTELVARQPTDTSSFANNLMSSIETNNESREIITARDITETLIKQEHSDSQDTIPAEDSWTDGLPLPFPVSIESANETQPGSRLADDVDDTGIMEELQEQLYLYTNSAERNAEEIDVKLEDGEEAMHADADGELNYKCKLCQKHFNSVELLVRHAKLEHPGADDMRYHCVLCNRQYKHARHLLQHTDIHSKATYRCGTCMKGFYRSSTLREHELRDHQGRYRHYCPKCHKGFMRPSTMQSHLNRNHPSWMMAKSIRKRLPVGSPAKSWPIFPADHVEEDSEDQGSSETGRVEKNVTQSETKSSNGGEQTVENTSAIEMVVVANAAGANDDQQPTQKKTKVVYQCKKCGLIYEMANSLVRHIQDQHRKSKLRCNLCRYRTSRSSDLTRHKRALHPTSMTTTLAASATQPVPAIPATQTAPENETPS